MPTHDLNDENLPSGSEDQISDGLDPGPEGMEMPINVNSTATSSLCK